MAVLKDLTGQTFGLWTVLGRGLSDSRGRARWVCVCQCGTQKESVQGAHLTGGKSTNCGCRRTEKAVAASKSATVKHGMYGTKTYWAWKAMWSRCTNEKNPSFQHYGARGIEVVPEWQSFENFYRDMGEAPQGLSLDRKDVNGPYCKDNCKWSSVKEQASNRTNTVRYAKNGEIKLLTEWVDLLGLDRDYIRYHAEALGLSRV